MPCLEKRGGVTIMIGVKFTLARRRGEGVMLHLAKQSGGRDLDRGGVAPCPKKGGGVTIRIGVKLRLARQTGRGHE